MKKHIFEGAGVALVTPFTGDNAERIDFDKLTDLIEFQIAGGIDAIVICATTGEASTMPDSEHMSAVRHCVDVVNKRVPVIAGTGSNDTLHAIKLSREAEKIGVDAILSVTPYYNKTTQEGLYRHFSQIAAKVDVPVILYNVPGRTNLNIDPKTYERLSKIENINAVKECNMNQLYDTIRRCGDDLNIYSGEDGQVFFPTVCGGLGVISVLANVAPKYVHDMVKATMAGDIQTGLKMQLDCQDMVNALFCEVNPMPAKEAANLMGLGAGPCRMPLCEISDEHKALVKQRMIEFGLLK